MSIVNTYPFSMKQITILFILTAFAVTASEACAKAPVTTVRLAADTCWVVWPEEPQAIKRALRDVEQDWYKVFGRLPTVLEGPPEEKNWEGPLVYLGLAAPWLQDMHTEKFAGAESFTLRVQSDPVLGQIVLATGADVRGAIYAAYALSEEFLGVDPWYYWVDKQPQYRGQVDVPGDYKKTWGPPTFRYRGFFINDEDLLARFAPDPMDENVFSLAMWDRVFETLLRLRGNMIIPGTFTFPDEKCQVLAARRGLINSQHHMMPLGLNTYQWPEDVPYSFHRHGEILEKYWKQCIDAMKDREVVWTVGYRGKHDRPFWEDEPDIAKKEQRGKIISAAIARQVELVRQVCPDADFICNLWNEGGELYKQGLLELPEGVIRVWGDTGTGTMRDAGHVKAGDGIYYHTAVFNFRGANQLTEAVSPARIHREISRFVRAGATSYFLVNVSDIRPVPMTTDYAMKMAWDASGELGKSSQQAMEDHLLAWSRRQFCARDRHKGTEAQRHKGVAARLSEVFFHPFGLGRKSGGGCSKNARAIAEVYKRYFATSYMQEGRCGDTSCGDNRIFQDIAKAVDELTEQAKADGPPSAEWVESARCDEKVYGRLRRYFSDLAERAEPLKDAVAAERRDFYQAHVLTPIAIYRRGFAILENVSAACASQGAAQRSEVLECLDEAMREYEEFFAALRQAEYGPWKGWYAGDKFVYIYQIRDDIRRYRALVAGEAPPAPTLPRERYPVIYRYQEKCGENFPLFYPGDRL